jgi:hypothetical protein
MLNRNKIIEGEMICAKHSKKRMNMNWDRKDFMRWVSTNVICKCVHKLPEGN